MKPSQQTTVELLNAMASECEFAAGLPYRDLETAGEYRAKASALRARANRMEMALLGRGGPVLAAVRRLNAPDATPGDTTPQGSSDAR